MPVGAQFTGRAADDGLVLNAAHAFQIRTDWHMLGSSLSAYRDSVTVQSHVPAGGKLPDEKRTLGK
jgi:hypothetical protein